MSRLPRPKMKRLVRIHGSDFLDVCQYDYENQVLDIQLKSGKAYRYRDVGAVTFTKLVTSESPGKVYNERVKSFPEGYTPSTRKAVRLRRNLWD